MFGKTSLDKAKRFKFTAYIGLDRNWWHYYNHYKSVIDHLVEGIEEHIPVNTVSSPLLFLIRHCLELGFKANILKLETVSNARSKLTFKDRNSHSLEYLYGVFKDHLIEIQNTHDIEQSLKQTINNYLIETEKLTNNLHQIDKGSYNFRYPVDTRGNYNFDLYKHVNIADIVDTFYKLQPFLVFTDQVLYEQGIFGFE